MPVRTPSNRRLHPQNTKVVDKAIDRIKTIAPIQQEKYWNAFKVNGYTCLVYNKLRAGRKCSCSTVIKSDPMLDEDGNASKADIHKALTGGLAFGVSEYAETSQRIGESTVIRELDTQAKPRLDVTTDLASPQQGTVEPDEFSMDFVEMDISALSNNRCGICYGSGYVGGYNLCFGNRFVFDTTYEAKNQFGFSIAQQNVPYSFVNAGSEESYVDFTVTLPAALVGIDRLSVWNNTQLVTSARIQAGLNVASLQEVEEKDLQVFCTGTPIIIRVSNVSEFTHLEIQINSSEEDTYLEYPRLTETGDLSVLDATQSVQINVSPKILDIRPWDIIVDTTLKRIWRVTDANYFHDRNYNIHGWDVSARVVQVYERFSILPTRENNRQMKRVTTLNKF